MKKTLLLSLFTLITWFSFAGEITTAEAIAVAKTNFQATHQVSSRSNIQTQLVYSKSFVNNTNQTQKAFYVFNMNQQDGFIIVAGDDKVTPILGYTDHGNFNPADMPRGLQKLFIQYKKGIEAIAKDNNIQATQTIAANWTNLKQGVIASVGASRSSVSPLTTTEWSQRPNYNRMCPDNSPTGCVATAVAQVMKYHNHPAQGTGNHSFNHNDYGTLSANYGAATYDWSLMPNKLYSNTLIAKKDEVSKLMYHIGVGLEMNYSPNGSGASSSDVPDVLKNYFGYDAGISMKRRSRYSLNGWKNLIKGELDAARVVYHRGFCPDPSAGHAFVIDGYDATDKFHLNWGWSGSYNGYFEINNLNPGSTYTWNSGQGAIVGIKPAVTNIDLKLFSNIVVNPVQIDFNQPFTVAVDIANYGGGNYNGKLKAALFDSLDNNIGDVEILNGVSISSTNYNTYTFSTTGMNVTPGTYSVGIYADLGTNQWSLIDQDSYANPLDVIVSSTNNLGLISDGAILVNPDPIKQNQSFQVEIDVINTGTTTFTGQISVDIHELGGDWIDEINHVSRTISAGGTSNIVLNHTGLSLTPGTYELVIWHKPTGGSWEIIEEGTYPNSRNVDITGLDFSENTPDQYESNDTIINPHVFPLSFSSGIATIRTSGANIHLKGDKDFYAIHLDPGYDYLVYARVYDNYNTGGQGTFTNDIMFNYHEGATKGTFYDDAEMPTILMNNIPAAGTDFIFELAPFYAEDIGSYLFEIEVIRQAATTSITNESLNKVKLFPNPSNANVTINHKGYNHIQVITMNGQLVKELQHVEDNTTIDVSNFDAGIYMVNLIGDNKRVTKRLEVIK